MKLWLKYFSLLVVALCACAILGAGVLFATWFAIDNLGIGWAVGVLWVSSLVGACAYIAWEVSKPAQKEGGQE